MEAARSVRELARRLGLSPATVSLALRGNVSVAAATRERVMAGATRHGYRPDPAMTQALTRRRGRVKSVRRTVQIAYVRSTLDDPLRENPHWRQPYQGLKAMAETRGFVVEDFNLRHYRGPQELRRILFHRGFHALVFGTFLEPRAFESRDWAPFALIEVGRCDVSPRVNCIRRDESSGIRRIWEKIRAAGYRRPGFCLMRHEPLLDDDRDRMGAWCMEARSVAKGDRVPPYRGVLPSVSERLLDWYHRHRPDVVIGFNGATRWGLQAGGVRLGEECAYWQLHVDPTELGVSGLLQDLAADGARCVPVLEQMLNLGKLGVPAVVEDVVLQPEWVDARPGGALH